MAPLAVDVTRTSASSSGAVAIATKGGASFPPVVLKIGYGPNISVVSAFFGYVILAVAGLATSVAANRFEANMAQTAGTAAGEIGFMCIVLAAIDMLNERPGLGFSLHLTSLQIFLWLTFAGLLGAFLAVPLRRHYIDEEDLTFADGTAQDSAVLCLDLTTSRSIFDRTGQVSCVTVSLPT